LLGSSRLASLSTCREGHQDRQKLQKRSRGYDTDNPGYGDTRFQPFDAADGRRVSSMYLVENESAALLETVFHEVHHDVDQRVYQSSLLQRLLVRLRMPVESRDYHTG